MRLQGSTYYHVETEGGHELILAEDVPGQIFIDYAGRDSLWGLDTVMVGADPEAVD